MGILASHINQLKKEKLDFGSIRRRHIIKKKEVKKRRDIPSFLVHLHPHTFDCREKRNRTHFVYYFHRGKRERYVLQMQITQA